MWPMGGFPQHFLPHLATTPHYLTHTHSRALLQTWSLRYLHLPGTALLPWLGLFPGIPTWLRPSSFLWRLSPTLGCSEPCVVPIGPCTHKPESAHHYPWGLSPGMTCDSRFHAWCVHVGTDMGLCPGLPVPSRMTLGKLLPFFQSL